MKNCRSSCLLLVALLFGALPTFSQKPKSIEFDGIKTYSITREAMPAVEFNTNRIPLKLGLMFISGAADGMTQVIAFHPDKFFAQHPNADRQFWDNQISWRNKYRNGDPEQGRAFIGSTTWLAWTTDAYHLFRTTSRLTAVAGLTIPLYKGSGKKLRHYAAEIGLSGLAWSAGFHTTYSLLYK